MQGDNASTGYQPLGIASLIFGILGGAFCWWTPLGMVMGLTGLVIGLAGWISGSSGTRNTAIAVGGLILSLATLALNFFIAGYGLEIVRFGPLR